MLKVGLLLYPNCLPAGVLTGLDFFRAANLLSQNKMFEVKTIGLEKGKITCAHKQELTPDTSAQRFNPDIVIVPGFWAQTPLEIATALSNNLKIQNFLNSIPKSTAIWSYCTGVIFHGKTGRLKNKEATATWWLTPYLELNFPNIKWDMSESVAGRYNDLTASGANGFYSLFLKGLELQKEDRLLFEIQKYLMIPTTFKIADPFYELEMTIASSPNLMRLKKIISSIRAHELCLEVVASRLSTTPKTLSRHLSKETEQTPAKLFRSIKYKQAADLLVLSGLSVPEICHKLGFEDESNFRRGFKSTSGMTPGDYQKRFKGLK
jgi:transcriptional regulator GlxA family with amidase domain